MTIADAATETGVYENLDETDYLEHPALSSSGAKALLPPSCPAIFKWQRDHGRPYKRAFDVGHAAHKAVLGIGADIVTVHADDWRTKSAREQAAAIRAAGGVPLLAAEVAQIEDMAAALRTDPLASKLLQAGAGTPETSLFWSDEQTGVQLRARLDWLPHSTAGRMIVPDYKTVVSANPAAFGKSAASYGYYLQAAWYCEGVTSIGLADDVAFVFVTQEKTPPYLVSVVELDAAAMRIGERRMRKAIEIFRDCSETDIWPGYSQDVELVSLPRWFEIEMDNEEYE